MSQQNNYARQSGSPSSGVSLPLVFRNNFIHNIDRYSDPSPTVMYQLVVEVVSERIIEK